MQSFNKVIAILVVIVAAGVAGCANVEVKRVPQIVGTDTTSVWLMVNKDGSGATLSGQVKRSFEKKIVEDYVRAEYGYGNITNLITSN